MDNSYDFLCLFFTEDKGVKQANVVKWLSLFAIVVCLFVFGFLAFFAIAGATIGFFIRERAFSGAKSLRTKIAENAFFRMREYKESSITRQFLCSAENRICHFHKNRSVEIISVLVPTNKILRFFSSTHLFQTPRDSLASG